MDNYEVNDDALKKQNNANDGSPKEEIPLWLQGMEEPLNDETKPIDAKSEQSGDWLREIEDINYETLDEDGADSPDSPDQDGGEFETEVDHSAFEETPPPEHHEDTSYPEESMGTEHIGEPEDHEVTEEIDVEAFTEQSPFDKNDADGFASEEGFVDISQLGLDQQAGDAVEFIDDESLREGDLPEWLQEMIAESEQESFKEADTDVEEIETIIPAPSDDSLYTSLEEEYREEALSEPKDVPSTVEEEAEEEEEIPETILDEVVMMTKEDTAPIALSEELKPAHPEEELTQMEELEILEEPPSVETPPISEIEDSDHQWAPIDEEPIAEAVSSGDEDAFTPVDLSDLPDEAATIEETYHDEEEVLISEEAPSKTDMEVIDRVKAYIEQGRMEQAQSLIDAALDDANTLVQLETVLSEMAKQPATASSEVLETLGDIALKLNKPKEAFDAYAKAIKLLLEYEGDSDEIS
jgi:tetratricopeptide (TPR) repeat protein